jgi:hypothetical protein
VISGLFFLAASVVGGAPPAAKDSQFVISINAPAWKKFGFRYPVTYVFQLPGDARDAQVQRRDGASGPWTPLESRAASDFFNGVECVRFDPATKKAYVSVGFGASNTTMLRFADVRSVKFDSVAKYYDGRKAAYTLSNDNWGCNAWAHPGAPWKGATDDASARCWRPRRNSTMRLVYARSQAERIAFEAAAIKAALDFAVFSRVYDDSLFEQLQERGRH